MATQEIISLVIENYDEEARGLAHRDGVLWRVPGGCVGDDVTVRVAARSHHRPEIVGTIATVVSRGAQFEPPPCPFAFPLRGRCGGCPAMHLSGEAQASLKRRLVEDALGSVGVPATVSYHPAPSPLGYRCRGQYVAARTRGGVRLGSYARRSHDVVRMDGCLIVRPAIAQAAQDLAGLLSRGDVPIYPEPGGVRHVALRADGRGQVVAELIVASEAGLSAIEPLAEEAVRRGLLAGMSASINDRDTDAVKVAPSRCLAGLLTVKERIGEVELELEAGGFSQLNLAVAETMYRRAAQLCGQPRTLWDLYAGSGALGLTAARLNGVRTLFGAESVEASVRQANAAARHMGLEARYQRRDLARGVEESWPAPDVVLVNPPRRGLDKAVLEQLKDKRPPVVVYMSCHPGTFARDAAALCAAGYKVTHLEAHDMLPQTTQVELLACLVI